MPEAARRAPSGYFDAMAEQALKSGPWSVTHHRPSAVAVGWNDYFSEALYWWPDPQNPGGPYIRRDCYPNPNRFLANARDLKAMSEALLVLGYGAYVFDRIECGRHAAHVLATWFVDPATRMTPHLEFGQAVAGISSGRGRGIIETVPLIYAAQGMVLLEASGGIAAELVQAVRRWFAEYLNWMWTSEKGRYEKDSTNNHATWWTAQVAAFALLTGDEAMQMAAWNHYRDYLIPTQLQLDGSSPKEEARPTSLSYSAMNLDGLATICRLAQTAGIDLWNFETDLGIGATKAFNYVVPYVLDPSRWSKEQIKPFNPDTTIFPGLAGIGYRSPELLGAYDQLPMSQTPWVQFIDLIIRNRL